jgi:hypothetical protein
MRLVNAEARDLVDILTVIRTSPELDADARRLLAGQDAVLLAERLLAWTDEAIEEDLRAYDDVSPSFAQEARDLLLKWARADAGEGQP